MIKVRNITDEEHKKELEEMIYSYYEDSIGTGWVANLPKKLKDFITTADVYTEKDIDKLYDEDEDETVERTALGLYSDDTIIGFVCVAVFEDNVGGIFQIFVKPEYRQKFISEFKGSMDATKVLTESLNEYFKKYQFKAGKQKNICANGAKWQRKIIPGKGNNGHI